MDIVSKQMFAHGLAYYEAGRYADALDYFTKIIEFSPDEWESRLYVANSYQKLGKLNQARNELVFLTEGCPLESIRANAFLSLKEVIYGEESPEPVRLTMPGLWDHLHEHLH